MTLKMVVPTAGRRLGKVGVDVGVGMAQRSCSKRAWGAAYSS